MTSTANSITKRRFVEQLPAVLQTDALKNFFAATVDNLFQPGTSENISGYIGQKPVYYDPSKDFYLAEDTEARTAYQLEPAMITINSAGIMTDILCYDDLISYLSSQGANVTNHSRMFEGDYYSWAPPVDLDKLNNYQQYVWLGSLTDDQANTTVFTLRAPRIAYSYDNSATTTYALPPAIPSLGSTGEVPAVLVNGNAVHANFANGIATIDVSGLVVNDIIETIRYGDLTQIIEDTVNFDFTPFLQWQSTSVDYTAHTINNANHYAVGDLAYAADQYGNSSVYICTQAHDTTATFLEEITNWAVAAGANAATTGSRVRLVDGVGTTVETARYYIFDGVGTKIELSPDYSGDAGGTTPQYIVIDRRSIENSPWALRNLWVHASSLSWTGQDFSARKAQRPILEFLPNIEMFNYGTNRLADVQATLSNSTAVHFDNWDTEPWDDIIWDQQNITVANINGQFFNHLGNSVIGSVSVDNDYILQPDDRLFVHQSAPPEPALNNLIYDVISNADVPLPDGATIDAMEMVSAGQPTKGDIFRIANGVTSVFADYVEWWYNGVEWVIAQNAISAPLFMLYSSELFALDDTNTYPGTDFNGSPLFAYEVGTGSPDPILGFPLVHDAYSQPVFYVDPVVNRVTYTGGEVVGYYYHHFIDNNTFSNDWFPVPTPSTQSLIANTNVYSIPLNLQANPGNFEVTTISRSQWFDQFSSIMSQQVGFTGQPFTNNNWRDTAKQLGLGDKILQHRSPLLKTMLVSANTNYDVPASIRYVDQEYTRYRNKFIQALIDIRNNGVLTDIDLPSAWVNAAIQQLRLNKTSDFPFAGSQMAGGQYFIPPTPSSMGLMPVAIPAMVMDTTYSIPVSLIRGHDGSMIPAFGDWRDPIMLAFEQLIYTNIPPQFKTEARAVFDIQKYIGGKYYVDALGYTNNEINTMLSPYFQRWAQSNGLEYRPNVGFEPTNPWSWNYGSTLDLDNKPVPGFWRGIYRYYFDTDRPHLSPWEMLGFIDKPVWWDGQYGPSPYTRGNTKLWDDLRDGRIRDGVRVGIDLRYARPNLYMVLPVDDEGKLLDPFTSKIIPQPPSYQQASQPWVMGDGSPVETLWRASPSFRYAMSQVGFLAKPARFMEQGWDTINQVQDSTGQWIYTPTGNRPQDSELYVHGEDNTSATKVVALGVQQWISDHMVSAGQAPMNFGTAIRGLQTRLAHKMAGYTTPDNLRVMADNFGIVPSEDVSVGLYRSPSVREEFYCGVLIEWTGQGWRVIGYDTRNPYFYTIPGNETGPKGVISLSDAPEPVINVWRANVYYPVGVNVVFDNTVWASIKGHTSTAKFEQKYWQASGAVPPRAPRVTTYSTFDPNNVVPVSYGTVYTDFQQMTDFLTGYGRYLTRQGWTFDEVDPDTQMPINWNLVAKEFLSWAQVNWQPGNFITLSPGAAGVTFATENGMVMNVLNSVSGTYSMLDRAGMPIDRRNIVVNRIGGVANMMSRNNDVFGARVNISMMEHILVFSNTTIFNDVIYEPLFNLRQPRLRLIGVRTVDWTGRLDMPGYVLIGDRIVSNFDKASEDLLTMYDIEMGDTANAVLTDHARHQIGYDSRDYLANLVLSDVEQFEFYQGLIHQKGAPGAFDKLLRSDFIEGSSTINFFEEWAIQISEYGAVDSRSRIAFLFGPSQIARDPQYIEFRELYTGIQNFDADPDWVELVDSPGSLDVKWVERPIAPNAAFPRRATLSSLPGDFPVAGYVRLDEVNHTVFTADQVETIYNATNATMQAGEVVWIHENDEIRNLTNAQSSTWYLLGTEYSPGHWDGSNTRTQANATYLATVDSELVFQSKPNDAPFITDDAQFVPTLGESYTVTFTVTKTIKETNGQKSYIRPAFDAFLSNGTIIGALGSKQGYGYSPTTDLIDTTNWIVGTPYEVSATWTSTSSSYVSARARLRVNRNYPTDDSGTVYSNAQFQIGNDGITVAQPIGWDAQMIYNMSANATVNFIANVITQAENPTIANNTVQVVMQSPHGLTNEDKGLFYVIDGPTGTDEDLQGVGVILNVGGANDFYVSASISKGFDFVAAGQQGPAVRVLRSIRFGNTQAFSSMQTRIGVQDGDRAYVDGSPWLVYQRQSGSWVPVRSQPIRMDAHKVEAALIYDLQTKITSTDLQPQPLSLDHLTVVSPLVGLIPGIAQKEINYMLEYDPAVYNFFSNRPQMDDFVDFTGSTTGDTWGANQVGKVWWDLSTVRFLETETDNVTFGVSDPDRYTAEVEYRVKNWGSIAPATSVDVYEWVRSTVLPNEYAGTGTVYNSDVPNYVQSEEYVGTTPTTMYYFWVKNVQVLPNLPFRTIPTETIAQYIINPLIEDEPWVAPIMPNGILAGGASPFVDDTFNVSNGIATSGTVLQVEVEKIIDDGVVHDEWILLRPNDELSLPPNWLWSKMRDSLVGFDNFMNSVPAAPGSTTP